MRRRRLGRAWPDHLAVFDAALWSGPATAAERDRYLRRGATDAEARAPEVLAYLAVVRWRTARYRWAAEQGRDWLPELRARYALRRAHLAGSP